MNGTPDRMLKKLREEIARIAATDPQDLGNEVVTKEVTILPLIEALGWNARDPKEVVREFSTGKGRHQVDYCLRHRGHSMVLVEAKRAGADLDEHQEQLMQYAFGEEAPLAALTDGFAWWLYVPHAGGDWRDRRFLQIELKSGEEREAAALLHRFLSHENVTNNSAGQAASEEVERQQRGRQEKRVLYEAWDRIVRGEDKAGMLPELIADEAREISVSGRRPSAESIQSFIEELRDTAPQTPAAVNPPVPVNRTRSRGPRRTATASPFATTGPTTHQERATPKRRKPARDYERPVAFRLRNQRYEVSRAYELLTRVCELLAEENKDGFEEAVLAIPGKKFSLSGQGGELRRPYLIAGTRVYVEVNVSGEYAERRAREVLRRLLGSDDGFEVEMEPPTRSG